MMGAVRFRFYLGGRLVRQETVEVGDVENLRELGDQHSRWMIERSASTKQKWMLEAEVLSDPTDPHRFLRFGTDDGGMREPHPLFG